jgi:hypothetical protein
MGNVPWFWPGVVVSLIVAIIAARRVAPGGDLRPGLTAALVFSVGLIISATLTPLSGALLYGNLGTGTCDLSRFGLPPLVDLRGLNDTTLNLMLFIPLGVAIGLVPRAPVRGAMMLLAVAFPFVIEMTQLLVPVLDRGCQSADIVDNLLGLIVGFGGGMIWRTFGRTPMPPDSTTGPDRPDSAPAEP